MTQAVSTNSWFKRIAIVMHHGSNQGPYQKTGFSYWTFMRVIGRFGFRQYNWKAVVKEGASLFAQNRREATQEKKTQRKTRKKQPPPYSVASPTRDANEVSNHGFDYTAV